MPTLIFLALLLVLPVASPIAESLLQNQLINHPSPYLAMHGEDPVAWQQWSSETLENARKLNRPLLVSIGYFSCHWCHVMQRESYRDPKLAAFLNQNFIPVKVDRELEPALDAHLIEYVQMTRGHAGWPLNVLLTPKGYPLIGVTYATRDEFYRLLERVNVLWKEDDGELSANAVEFMQRWQRLRTVKSKDAAISSSLTLKMRQQIKEFGDELAGGFGQQNKFPMVPQLSASLWMSRKSNDRELDDFLKLTLDQMASQGLRDQIAGGFFRYVTDPSWRIPHFEKMLYDNAQLALLYLQAFGIFDVQLYKEIGLNTLDFMLMYMQKADGSFLSSFSAVDEQGREGFYYLLSEVDRKNVLISDEQQAVNSAWFGKDAAESEYGSLPRWQADETEIAEQLGWSHAKLKIILSSARSKLLALRKGRTLPADGKSIAAWNGLALSALSAGYVISHDQKYQIEAKRLASFLMGTLWNGKQLARAVDDNEVMANASLIDYALVAQGLWDWCRIAHDQVACNQIVAQLVMHSWQHYYKGGYWTLSDTPLIPMLDGKLALEDSPLPSATAVISRLSQLHPDLKKDKQLQAKLNEHLRGVGSNLSDSIFWYASYIEVVERAQSLR